MGKTKYWRYKFVTINGVHFVKENVGGKNGEYTHYCGIDTEKANRVYEYLTSRGKNIVYNLKNISDGADMVQLEK